MKKNNLLIPSELSFNAIPFDQITNEDFIPALDEAIERAKEDFQKIAGQKEEPTFDNTILAMETTGDLVGHVSGVYSNLLYAEADEARQDLAKTMAAKTTAFSNDILLDEKLFARVKAVYEKRREQNLTAEQAKLLEKTYTDFARNGALLSDEDKVQLRKIDEEKSALSPQFAENVLKETNAYQLLLKEPEELAGLPDLIVAAAKEAASQKNLEGHLFTLDAPSFIPFMTYSENRPAREQMWRAFNSCATAGDQDNREILKKIASLRFQRAQLLGYDTHAHFVLEERMAESPEKVSQFMQRLLSASKTAAQKELQELQKFQKENYDPIDVQPWDVAFYSEKLKEKTFAFKEEELRPYFVLENVVQGAFEHAEELYDISFEELDDIPTYHPDVKVYRVYRPSSGDFIGLFYTDFFPRPTKKNGAWMTNFREQGLLEGKLQRPHVSIVCNFTKPTATTPSLLTLNEVLTLFHEFGHALHSLLSQCQYSSLSGTNVYWDFVELPSQINENWALEKETLDRFAKHYQSGDLIPVELTEKIKKSAQFQAGMKSLRQLSLGYLDLAYHSADPSQIGDVEEFETKSINDARLLPHIPGTMTSTRFSHIFSGGYSAGYYSYKWAEVLDADAFEMFKEKGLYNSEVAKSFRENILERGGTEHPMELYKRFRGREPDPNALLRREGLL